MSIVGFRGQGTAPTGGCGVTRSIKEALDQAVNTLRNQDDARLDSEVLLAFVLDRSRSHLHAWPEAGLDAEQLRRFEQLIAERARGRPVAHLTGRREFWSLDLEITTDTLIPRPETELLVEQALALLPAQQNLRIADLGTGSGAIAIALAKERKAWSLCALDRSLACCRVAQRNAQRLGLYNIDVVNADWCDALAASCLDAILCNPPYVADRDPHLQRGDLRYEPRSALASGTGGLDAISRLAADTARVLKKGAWLFLEHGYDQSQDVYKLLNNKGFTNISCIRDLAGIERVTRARKPA
ncbi:MAG TPA: peptide chain release factor N(5)-glutamine methyltransferase [Gammaproteobacteria bacterium]|nr:peptide chain release factor N(5)-glutamine methyltransferase [Gammaproteobacteria bacterium]